MHVGRSSYLVVGPMVLCTVTSGCRDRAAPAVPPAPQTSATSASVATELGRENKETRLYAGAVANLLGDGARYLVVGGYKSGGAGRAADVAVYKQSDAVWSLQWQSTWQGAKESTVRNVSI